jgi:hypothetical protein
MKRQTLLQTSGGKAAKQILTNRGLPPQNMQQTPLSLLYTPMFGTCKV